MPVDRSCTSLAGLQRRSATRLVPYKALLPCKTRDLAAAYLRPMLSRVGLSAAILCAIAAGREAGAQTVLDRTPNLAGAWIGAPGVLHFNFLHRFSVSPAPERKVNSAPTFLLAAGLPARTLFGVHYASNSELSPRYPNEWEMFGRFAPLDQELGAPLDASAQVGYNLAAEGLDGEIAVARRQG